MEMWWHHSVPRVRLDTGCAYPIDEVSLASPLPISRVLERPGVLLRSINNVLDIRINRLGHLSGRTLQGIELPLALPNTT